MKPSFRRTTLATTMAHLVTRWKCGRNILYRVEFPSRPPKKKKKKRDNNHKKNNNKNKVGDLYSVYPALPGGSRRWEQSVLTGILRQTGNRNECYLSHSTAYQNERLLYCHRWDSLQETFGMLAHLPDQSAKSHPYWKKALNVTAILLIHTNIIISAD
jgi:hypothetical protein